MSTPFAESVEARQANLTKVRARSARGTDKSFSRRPQFHQPAVVIEPTRTWVSGVGDDANPCSRTAPCKTFAGAISKTAVHGEINCLDHAGYGALTITKSITLDCHERLAGITHSATNGITINFDNFTAVGESQKTVRLRNLNFFGLTAACAELELSAAPQPLRTARCSLRIARLTGATASPGRGIEDFRGHGGLLVVDNTTITNVASAAISVDPGSAVPASTTTIKVRISNSRVAGTVFGLNFGSNVKRRSQDRNFRSYELGDSRHLNRTDH